MTPPVIITPGHPSAAPHQWRAHRVAPRQLGLDVITERIETDKMLESLRRHGCCAGQGYCSPARRRSSRSSIDSSRTRAQGVGGAGQAVAPLLVQTMRPWIVGLRGELAAT
jgi:hypothetical protein